MPNDTLSELLPKGNTSRGALVRNMVVVSAALAGMQFVAMKSAEVTDYKSDNPQANYKLASMPAMPQPRLDFVATAYSYPGTTKSGLPAAPGLIAADPKVLPLGSLIHLEHATYRGLYQVMDTGRLIKGKRLDLFLLTPNMAKIFGRQKVKLTVLRYGYLWQGDAFTAARRAESPLIH